MKQKTRLSNTGERPATGKSCCSLQVTDWGRISYAEAHRRQLIALEDRLAGRRGDALFMVEHPHVYTLGRGTIGDAPDSSPFGAPVECVAIERGGGITYHGPGQLVAYPVLDIKVLTGDLHQFLYWLEEMIIRTIAGWGISGQHHSSYTGVWVGQRKIASVGVAVRKWVSYHGVALNVSTDLRYFDCIRPCGLASEVMTSMEQLLGERVELSDVKAQLAGVSSSIYCERIALT